MSPTSGACATASWIGDPVARVRMRTESPLISSVVGSSAPWTIPAACTGTNAVANWVANFSAWFGDSGPRPATLSAKVSPAGRSVATQYCCPIDP